MFHLSLVRFFAVGIAALMTAVAAQAQTAAWPDRPIRVVVASGPASGGDIFARLISEPLSVALKQTVFVETKPGGSGIIGIDTVAKAAPDGYTMLLVNTTAIAINPVLHKNLPYNFEKDLIPVVQVGAAGTPLIVTPQLGVKTLQDLVRYVKANPGKESYASWGNGSSAHLVMEALKTAYGLDMTHIPYKTNSQVISDMLAGTINIAITDVSSPLPHVKAGKLIAVAITGSTRGPALPSVPTMTEQGFKFDMAGWYGVFVPAGTPIPIVNRLNEELSRIMNKPEMRQRFAAQGMDVPPSKSAEQFAVTVKHDSAAWQSLAHAAKIGID